MFASYSSSSKAFSVFSKRTLGIKESIHIVFNEFSLSDDRLREKEDQEDWMTSHIYQSLEETSKQFGKNPRKKR